MNLNETTLTLIIGSVWIAGMFLFAKWHDNTNGNTDNEKDWINTHYDRMLQGNR